MRLLAKIPQSAWRRRTIGPGWHSMLPVRAAGPCERPPGVSRCSRIPALAAVDCAPTTLHSWPTARRAAKLARRVRRKILERLDTSVPDFLLGVLRPVLCRLWIGRLHQWRDPRSHRADYCQPAKQALECRGHGGDSCYKIIVYPQACTWLLTASTDLFVLVYLSVTVVSAQLRAPGSWRRLMDGYRRR